MTAVNLITYSDADFSLAHTSTLTFNTDPLINPLRMHVRKAADDNTVWLEASTVNGLILITGAHTLTLYIPEIKLLALPPGAYVQSLIMSQVDGPNFYRTEVWRGTLTHNSGPTRWEAGLL